LIKRNKAQEVSPHKKGVFALLGFFLVALYAWTAPPGTTPEDASEFILTAFFKGLAHPPGYPLFVGLGHLFSYCPWGSPAQKIALLSHLCMAGSALIWGVWALSLTQNLVFSSWVVLTFGLSLPVWSGGQLVEVYPLHTFLLTSTFFLAFKLTQAENENSLKKYSFLFGLFLGLSLSNHYPLVVLAFPALGVLLASRRNLLLKGPLFGRFFVGVLLGLLPYVHLWTGHTYSDFLFSGPIRKMSEFLDYILRKEYAQNDRSKVFSFREWGLYSWESVKMLFWAFTPLAFLASVFGARKTFKKSEVPGLSWALVLGTLSSFQFLFLFWQPDYYRLAIELFETFHGFALGCFLLFSAQSIWLYLKGKPKSSWLLWALYAIPLGLGLIQFKALDRRDDTLPSEYASLVLDSLPQNALLLVKGDADAGILAYAHFLEKKTTRHHSYFSSGSASSSKTF